MTIASKLPSPSCARSLEAQLRATLSDDIGEDPSKQPQAMSRLTDADADASLLLDANSTTAYPVAHARNLIFRLSALTGSLSTMMLRNDTTDASSLLDDLPTFSSVNSGTVMRHMLATLFDLSTCLSIDLHSACSTKIDLNSRKYPVELCKGKSGKYTEYSNVTGISKTVGQSTVEQDTPNDATSLNGGIQLFLEHSIPVLTARTRQFATDRDWLGFHTPRNLMLALTGELGELAEILQFKGDDEYQLLSIEEHDKIKQEVADVTIYLLRLADESGVSL